MAKKTQDIIDWTRRMEMNDTLADVRFLAERHADMIKTLVPFGEGDRVRLTKVPNFDKAPGWVGHKATFVPGAEGLVTEVDWNPFRHAFVAGVVFDRTLANVNGGVVEARRPATFFLDVDHLEKIAPQVRGPR